MSENDIIYKSLYKIGIWTTNLLEELNIDYWIKVIYDSQKAYPKSIERSNKGGYQSPVNLVDVPIFSPLVKILNQYHFKITKDSLKTLTYLWVNISSFGNYNALHNHGTHNILKGEEDLSGILYLKVPLNSGNLVFTTPFDINSAQSYIPSEGNLLFFNKSLPHSVEPNLSQEDRISIAFNYE